MKKITLLLGVALMTLVMASCGSQKQVASNLPCPDCQPTTEVFRYLGQHVATGDRLAVYKDGALVGLIDVIIYGDEKGQFSPTVMKYES